MGDLPAGVHDSDIDYFFGPGPEEEDPWEDEEEPLDEEE